MEQQIQDIIIEVLGKDRETLLENFDSAEIWDSMQRVEILLLIEDEYAIQFDEDELAALKTPKQLCEVVLRKAV